MAPNDELTQYRLKAIEDTLASIGESIRQLTILERNHAETRQSLERAFASIEKCQNRIRDLEIEMPTMKLVRTWVIGGIIGCASLLGMTLFKLVTH